MFMNVTYCCIWETWHAPNHTGPNISYCLTTHPFSSVSHDIISSTFWLITTVSNKGLSSFTCQHSRTNRKLVISFDIEILGLLNSVNRLHCLFPKLNFFNFPYLGKKIVNYLKVISHIFIMQTTFSQFTSETEISWLIEIQTNTDQISLIPLQINLFSFVGCYWASAIFIKFGEYALQIFHF